MTVAIYGPSKNGESAIFRPQSSGAITALAAPGEQRVIFGPWQAENGNVIFGLYATPSGGYDSRKGKAAKSSAPQARSVKQEVAALAAALTKSAKLTKTAKKKRREEVIAEVIKRLDDVPNVEEVAPIIAQAVVRREAQIAALPPSQVTAGEQRSDIVGVIEQQIAKWRRTKDVPQPDPLSHIDDESEIEMLLLG